MGIEHLFSLVAVGESIPKAHLLYPCPAYLRRIITDVLGRTQGLVQVHRHLFLAAPYTYSGLLIWFLTSPRKKNGSFKFSPIFSTFLFHLVTLTRM